MMSEEELSRREALEQAFDAAEDPGQQDPPQPDPGQGDEPAGEAPPAAAEGAGDEPAAGPARDAQGRFVSRQAAETPEPVPQDPARPPVDPTPPPVPDEVQAAAQPAPAADAGAGGQGLVAPQSWKPLAREAWKDVPEPIRQEVTRREHEMQNTLNETAQARQMAQAFEDVWRPHEQLLRAGGTNPLQFAAQLFQTASTLRTAPPQQRAAAVAQIISDYGVDIQMLDQILAQRPQTAGQGGQNGAVDPRVDQVIARQQQWEDAVKQQVAAAHQQQYDSALSEVEAFGKDKEFFEDVREVMADLIEVAERRGSTLSLEAAYNQAIAINPELSQIMQQREAAAQTAARNQELERAQSAASSVRSHPAGGQAPKPENMSRRDAIAAAFEEHAG